MTKEKRVYKIGANELLKKLTTFKNLSLISEVQTLKQLDPNPWMMILVGADTLKFDSLTKRHKTFYDRKL